MKTLTKVIISTLLILSAANLCFADPPDPPAPQQPPPSFTIVLPG